MRTKGGNINECPTCRANFSLQPNCLREIYLEAECPVCLETKSMRSFNL